MGLNTKIDWQNLREGWKLDATWNPITGCKNNCSYCFARKLAIQRLVICGGDFEPRIHPNRLEWPEKQKKPLTIFVTDMGDMWGKWVADEWIEKVLGACEKAPQHRYLFLTKNPMRYREFDFTPNLWLGATITGADKEADAFRVYELPSDTYNTFLSIEPLLGIVPKSEHISHVDWVIVGAQTKPDVVPKREWIDSIKHPNIFYKSSIQKLGYKNEVKHEAV